LKPEQWGSPLVQEKYQEEKACDKRHPYRIIIIIIIIIITTIIIIYYNNILFYYINIYIILINILLLCASLRFIYELFEPTVTKSGIDLMSLESTPISY